MQNDSAMQNDYKNLVAIARRGTKEKKTNNNRLLNAQTNRTRSGTSSELANFLGGITGLCVSHTALFSLLMKFSFLNCSNILVIKILLVPRVVVTILPLVHLGLRRLEKGVRLHSCNKSQSWCHLRRVSVVKSEFRHGIEARSRLQHFQTGLDRDNIGMMLDLRRHFGK